MTTSSDIPSDLPPLKPAPPAGIIPVPKVPPLGIPQALKQPLAAADPVASAALKAAALKAQVAADAAKAAKQDSIDEDDEQDPRPGKERLRSFAEKIQQRLDDVTEIFKDTTYDPTKNADFKKFLSDQAAEMAMRYVRIGVVHAYDADAITPDARERQMKKKGFSVGQSATGAANAQAQAQNETGETTSAGTEAADDLHDRQFLESPAVQAAKAMGFDPHSDD